MCSSCLPNLNCSISLHPTDGAVKYVNLQSEIQVSGQFVRREEVKEGHNLWSRVQRVGDKHLFWFKKNGEKKSGNVAIMLLYSH